MTAKRKHQLGLAGKAFLIALLGVNVGMLIGQAWAPVAQAQPYRPNPSGQQALARMGEIYSRPWDSTYVSGHLAVTTSSQQFTIPDDGMNDAWQICGIDTSVWIKGGANPTVATTAGGASDYAPAGGCTERFVIQCLDADADGACDTHKLAYKGAAAGFMLIKRYPQHL